MSRNTKIILAIVVVVLLVLCLCAAAAALLASFLFINTSITTTARGTAGSIPVAGFLLTAIR